VKLMADSSKVNRSGFLIGMGLNRIHTLVTDEGTPADMRDSLRDSVRSLVISGIEGKDE
jgi:DeoR/GlpR family transcriptional regulator of sugar metabolism